VRRNAALLLLVLGRHDETAAISEYAAQFDPLSTHVIEGAGLSYTFGNRLDEAEASFRKLLQISPNYIGGQYHLGKVLLLKGEATAALEAFENELDDEYRTKGRALAQHALGNTNESDAALKELIDNWGERWPAEVAQVYAFRGELDKAFEWMEREIELSGLGGFGEGRWMRLFDNLRADSRWQDLLQRTKMSDEHLAAVKFVMPALP
jgi:tetratricopeptide (TPR) repeat protein